MSAPNTTIKMGVYPRPQGGNHVVTYATQAARQASVDTYMDVVRTEQQFVRPTSGTFRIDAAYSEVENCNYGYFQNGSGRVYYFDIMYCEYDNDLVSIVHFDIDVLATYFDSWQRTEQYVLREHTNDDTVGANLQPEPVGTGELTVDWQTRTSSSPGNTFQSSYSFDLREPCVFIYAGDQFDGNKVYAGVLDGTVEGACVWACPLNLQEDGDYQTGPLTDWLWSMNRSNKAESIVAMTMYPLDLVTVPSGTVTPLFGESGEQFVTRRMSFSVHSKPTSVDGYTPRNKKLLTYPYSFFRCTNYKGQYRDYRYEFIEDMDNIGTLPFFLKGSPDPAGDIWCCPGNYNGCTNENPEFAVTLGGIPQISWSFNSYENWLTGNAGSLVMNLVSAATMFIPAARAVGVGVKAATALSKSTALAPAAGTVIGSAGGAVGRIAERVGAGITGAINGVKNAGGLAALGAGMGANQIGNTVATLYDQSNVPDAVRGQTTGAATLGYGCYGFSFMGLSVREEYAESIDAYFDMYGYATNQVKVPNEAGRANVNFVQTLNASFRANPSNTSNGMPAWAVARVNEMYDEGIWFWHLTSNAGNFGADNSIVS